MERTLIPTDKITKVGDGYFMLAKSMKGRTTPASLPTTIGIDQRRPIE